MEDAAMQKAKNAMAEAIQSAASKRLPPKNSGIKTNVFFTHW